MRKKMLKLKFFRYVFVVLEHICLLIAITTTIDIVAVT